MGRRLTCDGARGGSGLSGEVRLCVSKATREEFAVKIVDRTQTDEKKWAKFCEEIDILGALSHPNIIRMQARATHAATTVRFTSRRCNRTCSTATRRCLS
jgi:hypothetical protein